MWDCIPRFRCLAHLPSGRHTRTVRTLCISLILLAAVRSEARSGRVAVPEQAHADPGDFWREVVEPHGDEVRDLLAKARLAIKIADDAVQIDAEWAVDQRMRYFQDAYGILGYARRLSPENVEILTLLGRAADELGKTRQAIEAFEAAIHILGPDKASPELFGRLGAIYLRLGDRDAAIRWLRLGQGPLTPVTAPGYVHLANALAARGEITAAVDTLVNLTPGALSSVYGSSQELTLVSFTLAMIYDRDEQRSAAFEVLDRMQSAMQTQYGTQVQNALALMRFAPAEDQHYYQGLLYESLGQLTEARAEWALYAASGETPWRARALEHVHAIDAQRRAPAPRPVTKAPKLPVPGAIP
jgi:hypothetical protein